MHFQSESSFYSAKSFRDALSALDERGPAGQAIAGGTWVMRAALRGASQERAYVSLSRLEQLRQVALSESEIDIGACVTHSQLALALQAEQACRSLAVAAGRSANPAVRNVATIGGNLCSVDFAAADLVPALMALSAQVEVEATSGCERMSVERFVTIRGTFLEGCQLVRRIIVPRKLPLPVVSAHIRLPLRKAGDYPVAIVSVAVALKQDRTVAHARVVVGSVELAPRRWESLEADLVGRLLDPKRAIHHAEATTNEFNGRDSVEAPGWYRVKVLPTLVGRAVEQLILQ